MTRPPPIFSPRNDQTSQWFLSSHSTSGLGEPVTTLVPRQVLEYNERITLDLERATTGSEG